MLMLVKQNVINPLSSLLLIVAILLAGAAVSNNCSISSDATAAPGSSSSKKVAPVPRPDVNPDQEIFQPPVKPLSPEESKKHFYLPKGYEMDPVLVEPHIKEPVAIEFDADGRMYVAEMRTYMQNISGENQKKAISRVSVHVDSNSDGRYDEHRVFANNLKLPRMLLALREGELLISETWDDKVYLYRDTDGDLRADEKELYFKGTVASPNLEHQSSGLVWTIDNWLHMTFFYKGGSFCVRWNGSRKRSRANSKGQWGLTQDNYGKLWFVNGGHELGPLHFQQPISYGAFSFENETGENWRTVYPLCAVPDPLGGDNHLRDNNTLNHFTATCGPEIVRAHGMPQQLQGDLLFAEPVGRLIRRGSVVRKDGVTHLRNPYRNAEFIRSTDPCFRPVNIENAPDGSVYIVDMYRGIIQESQWVNPGHYLYKTIKKYGLDKIIGHGRIWRLGHRKTEADTASGPQMYDQSSSKLVQHLAHPNGWWRDMAQRQLVLRQDPSVTDRLRKMVRSHSNHLARIHALWTLEGLNALNTGIIKQALTDKHPYVRKSAVRASETLFHSDQAGNELKKRILKQFRTDKHPQVRIQVLLTARLLDWKRLDDILSSISIEDNGEISDGVKQTIQAIR